MCCFVLCGQVNVSVIACNATGLDAVQRLEPKLPCFPLDSQLRLLRDGLHHKSVYVEQEESGVEEYPLLQDDHLAEARVRLDSHPACVVTW